MAVRGIRGATTSEENTSEAIIGATDDLLTTLIEWNTIEPDEIASIIFTTTADLTADFPAYAARQHGWVNVPLLCSHEMAVPGSLPRCIRILIHLNTERPQSSMRHAYLREAVSLRRDLLERFGDLGPEVGT